MIKRSEKSIPKLQISGTIIDITALIRYYFLSGKKKTNPKFFVNPITIDKLKEMLVIVLGVYSTGLRRYAIQQHLSSYEPGLEEIPGIDIMSPILSELGDQIIIKKGFWLRQHDFIILRENDEKNKEKIRLLEKSKIKFYGRKISPDDFINELRYFAPF